MPSRARICQRVSWSQLPSRAFGAENASNLARPTMSPGDPPTDHFRYRLACCQTLARLCSCCPAAGRAVWQGPRSSRLEACPVSVPWFLPIVRDSESPRRFDRVVGAIRLESSQRPCGSPTLISICVLKRRFQGARLPPSYRPRVPLWPISAMIFQG